MYDEIKNRPVSPYVKECAHPRLKSMAKIVVGVDGFTDWKIPHFFCSTKSSKLISGFSSSSTVDTPLFFGELSAGADSDVIVPFQ
jgi:hypothetical protein